MQSSFFIPSNKAALFQTLVKQHNLRFLGSLDTSGDRCYVSVDGDHLTSAQCNAFFLDWQRLNTNIRETSTPSWKRLVRRYLGSFSRKFV